VLKGFCGRLRRVDRGGGNRKWRAIVPISAARRAQPPRSRWASSWFVMLSASAIVIRVQHVGRVRAYSVAQIASDWDGDGTLYRWSCSGRHAFVLASRPTPASAGCPSLLSLLAKDVVAALVSGCGPNAGSTASALALAVPRGVLVASEGYAELPSALRDRPGGVRRLHDQPTGWCDSSGRAVAVGRRLEYVCRRRGAHRHHHAHPADARFRRGRLDRPGGDVRCSPWLFAGHRALLPPTCPRHSARRLRRGRTSTPT